MNKKILLICLFILSVSYYNLKAVNLAVGFLGQFALSGANTNSSKIFPSDFRDFDTGFNFTIGINNKITDLMSFSILLDLGYYHDSYDLSYNNVNGKRAKENYGFESFLIGGYGRLNFGFFSLGAGGGAKIPGSASYKIDSDKYYRKYKLSLGDLNDIFESAIIPYVKFSLDFQIFNYLMLGLYCNYDFPIYFQKNGYLSDIIINKDSLSSFDIGFQFGYMMNISFN